MSFKSSSKALLTALSAMLLFSAAVEATPFDDGVRAYNARQYQMALGYFTNAARQSPNDGLVRYYMGLTYQGMNQISYAKQQYEWVANYGFNQQLRSQAQTALASLAKYKTSWSSPNGSPAIQQMPQQQQQQQQMPMGGGPQGRINGKLVLIDFYADWCGPCKRFAPVFESVVSHMGSQVEHRRVNVDDHDNADVQKYHEYFNTIPTVIWTDRTGQMLQKTGGFPDEETFQDAIKQFLAQHK